MVEIFFGSNKLKENVSLKCQMYFTNNFIIYIPSGNDNRTKYFGDPVPSEKKYIFISSFVFPESRKVYININTNEIFTDKNVPKNIILKFYEISSLWILRYKNLNLLSFLHEYPLENKIIQNSIQMNDNILQFGTFSYLSLVVKFILKNPSQWQFYYPVNKINVKNKFKIIIHDIDLFLAHFESLKKIEITEFIIISNKNNENIHVLEALIQKCNFIKNNVKSFQWFQEYPCIRQVWEKKKISL